MATPSLRIYFPWDSTFAPEHFNNATLLYAWLTQAKTHPQTQKPIPAHLVILGALNASKEASTALLHKAMQCSGLEDLLQRTEGALVVCGQLGGYMSQMGTSRLWTSWEMQNQSPNLVGFRTTGTVDSVQVWRKNEPFLCKSFELKASNGC